MIHLDNFALFSPMYKGGLVVLQALSMYSYRGLLWNSQLYSSCCLERDLRHSSTLDNLAFDSAHTPVRSSFFMFSCKIVSRAIQTPCFNIIICVLKCVIFPWNFSTRDSSALLNVFVPLCTGCPITMALVWAFNDSLGTVCFAHYVCHAIPHDHAHHAGSLLLTPRSNFPGLLHLWRQCVLHPLQLSNIDALVDCYLYLNLHIIYGHPFGGLWT